ncbi:MAG: hypothetical protein ACON4G_04480, partial [Candidatus Puniceispirillaceae bacterium]
HMTDLPMACPQKVKANLLLPLVYVGFAMMDHLPTVLDRSKALYFFKSAFYHFSLFKKQAERIHIINALRRSRHIFDKDTSAHG